MNYGEVISHFKNVINRSDISDDLAKTFLRNGISRIQRQLRTAMNERIAEFSFVDPTAYIVLPADFLELISLTFGGTSVDRVPISVFKKMSAHQETGVPHYFTREQEKLLIYPTPDKGTIELYYYAEFDQLEDEADTNALITVAPDLVIYAGLTYAADYYLDDRVDVFTDKYNSFLLEVQEQANDQELNGGPLTLQPTYAFQDV